MTGLFKGGASAKSPSPAAQQPKLTQEQKFAKLTEVLPILAQGPGTILSGSGQKPRKREKLGGSGNN